MSGHLASSIHTIHRPLARSRRLSIPPARRDGATPYSPVEEEENESDILSSGDEGEAEDFEETPRPPDSRPPHINLRIVSESAAQKDTRHDGSIAEGLKRIVPSRAGSMATVRLQRRAGLAAKLKDVFELDGIEEVWAGTFSCMDHWPFSLKLYSEMPCWLLRSVCESFTSMTLAHILIYQRVKCSITRLHVSDKFIPVFLRAYAIKRGPYSKLDDVIMMAPDVVEQDQILKSGSLNKKAQRTKRWIKHWFILKNDALSWYQSSSVRSFVPEARRQGSDHSLAGSILPPRHRRSALCHFLRPTW